MNDQPSPAVVAARTRSVATCMAARQDNFLLLRFIAASLVIFGHSWAIGVNPTGETDWLGQQTKLFSGTLAVHIFFFISGFMVTMSYERRHSLSAFAKARLLRIFPALFVCVSVTALVLGPLVSDLPLAQYFGDAQWRRYLKVNALLVHTEFNLPGVFANNPYPHIVNGSLYTIPGEIQMYLYVALLGMLGLLRSRRKFALALAALVLLALFFRPPLQMLSQQEFYAFAGFFAVGAICWMYRQQLPVNGYLLIALLLACKLPSNPQEYLLVLAATTIYASLWFVFVPGLQGFNRCGDYSYGLYLYGFVVQQTIAAGFPQFGPYQLFAASFPLALLLAMASWHWVEKPMLRLK